MFSCSLDSLHYINSVGWVFLVQKPQLIQLVFTDCLIRRDACDRDFDFEINVLKKKHLHVVATWNYEFFWLTESLFNKFDKDLDRCTCWCVSGLISDQNCCTFLIFLSQLSPWLENSKISQSSVRFCKIFSKGKWCFWACWKSSTLLQKLFIWELLYWDTVFFKLRFAQLQLL